MSNLVHRKRWTNFNARILCSKLIANCNAETVSAEIMHAIGELTVTTTFSVKLSVFCEVTVF